MKECPPPEECATPKGHFLNPDSLDKGVCFDKYSVAKGIFFFEVFSEGYFFFYENP